MLSSLNFLSQTAEEKSTQAALNVSADLPTVTDTMKRQGNPKLPPLPSTLKTASLEKLSPFSV
jgi:hypothetical protein